MTLLITVIAAIVSTVLWYSLPESKMRIGSLALMYWGAALMWFVDALVEYIEVGAEYFSPAFADAANDAFLGVCVVVFGLMLWLAGVLLKDPSGRIRRALAEKN